MQCHAALARAARPAGPVLLTLSRAESLRFHPKRHPMTMDVHGRLRRRGPPDRRARPHRRRHRRVRERRRQGAGARGRPRLRRRTGSERRHRGARRLHEQPAVRGDARLRREPGRPSRSRACSTASPSGSASTAGRSAGATRSRSGDRFGTGQVLGPGVGIKALPRGRARRRIASAPLRGDRLRREEHRHRQRRCAEYGTAILRPEADGIGHAVPLVDRDGPGRAHGARARSPARSSGCPPTACA